jgi:outer membrane protein assembly factor BamD
MTVVLSGCAVMDYGADLIDSLFGDVEEQPPSELMMEGDEHLAAGRYQSAADAFMQIKDRYPYSPYALRAELKMADALFLREDYNTAWEAYDEFERLHPRNDNIPYVIYRKGDCHLEQVATIDRDQTHTMQAKAEYERLIKRFPGHPYSKTARQKIRKCLIFLSEYELYVGHFYFRNEQYKAAMGRYKYIIEHYPDMGQYHEAMEYIRICRSILAQRQAEQEAEEAERAAQEEQEKNEAAEEEKEPRVEPEKASEKEDT